MLSAAAAALLSGPALAVVGPTELKTVVTTPQKTSVTGDLTIDSGAGINVKSTTPALTIDSNATVLDGGTITDSGTAAATAVLIDTSTTSITGSFTGNGIIDMTGTGNNKIGIHLNSGNPFIGSIVLDSSTVSMVGDTSTGLLTDLGSQMYGDINLGGTFQMNSATANETTSSGNILVHLLGTLHGNLIVASSSSYTSVGNGAEGIVIGGPIVACDTSVVMGCTEAGTFSNSGSINVAGVVTRSTTSTNAEGGPALIVGASVAGGILNNGPASAADTTVSGVITGNGTGAASAVVVISPQDQITPMIIGLEPDTVNTGFSFINRGNINATPVDPNIGTRAIEIGGNSLATVTFTGGFFNSGGIIAQATSISPGSPVSAIGLTVDSYVTLPEIYVSAQSIGVNSASGSISAAIAGPEGGSAVAILINGAPVSNGATTTVVTHVPTIVIESGARIVASATVTDPTSADVTSLTAIGIRDVSDSLTTLNNFGTISATATTLTNGVTSIAHAVDTSLNTQGLNFTNTGTVVGDVLLGSGNDSYTVQGTSSFVASQNGAINFGFSAVGGADTLHVASFANVAGAITAQGTLDVAVDGTGTLTVENVGTTLATRDFTVAGGTTTTNAGTINITVSQAASVPVITASDAATLGTNANLSVTYGSFINTGGAFTLLSAPHGHLNVAQSDVDRYNLEVGGGSGGTLPFLFLSAGIQRVDNVNGQDILQLSVVPKTVTQLGLTGYGAALFSTANIAVATDSALGAAMIAGINSKDQAQSAYDAFAPDVSGGARQIAISLTDQASGVVAARQRSLRLFGKQPGDLTLWGNEFGEYISTKGGNVTQDFTGATSALEPGFKDHGFGFSLGLDEGSPNNGWYGAAFSFYTGDISEGGDRDSKTSTLWYMLSGYTDWRGKGLFLDTQVTLGYGNFKGKRFLDLTIPITGSTTGTTFSREADSKRAGLVASIGGTLGAIMKYGATTVIPQLSLDGMSMREEGYTEINGGTGFDLAVKPYYANSLRVFLGSEFREDINLGDFYLQPSARIGYRYDLLNDPVKLHAAFADINTNLSGDQNGTPFTVQGPDPSQGNYVAGFNLAATTDNWTIGLNYDFVRGSNNATEQVGTLTLLGRI
jgi:hypothetical protein